MKKGYVFAFSFALAFVALVGLGNIINPPSGGAGAVWGAITGTLSSQSDLNTALGTKPTAALDTDATMAANSDARVASQKATKTADAAVLTAAQAYTDQQIQDFDLKDPVKAATTSALPFSPSYSNGSSGVGATLTGAVGILAFDGYTPALNDRLLVKNQAAPAQNGIYKLTTVGTVVVGYVLTREPDFNQTANILYGDLVGVLNGTANANQQFTMNNQAAITVGTTAITFAQTSGGSQLVQGTGITITGNTVAIDPAVVPTVNSVGMLVFDPTTGSIDPLTVQQFGALSSATVSYTGVSEYRVDLSPQISAYAVSACAVNRNDAIVTIIGFEDITGFSISVRKASDSSAIDAKISVTLIVGQP